MRCVICDKGPMEGLSLYRVNKKGVPGIWSCWDHRSQTDAPPVDPTAKLVVESISRAGPAR